eukprot:CAMPEP_0194516444 /NCGR_PEP_ID=MMETSP0253-20130528/49332_1 /TAXON_ID=2966 /ORGANISM="Noctiluca scintillans" /LENGTH=54 /DNA_ID=CAMNT_0039360297 /DNA_START=92 /DNA_END=256 /DNA_ORIENTATION=-
MPIFRECFGSTAQAETGHVTRAVEADIQAKSTSESTTMSESDSQNGPRRRKTQT